MSNTEAWKAAEEAVMEAMTEHGPDGHIDGYEIITRAAVNAYLAAQTVEWEYGKALRGKPDNPALSPSLEIAQRDTDEWNHRIRPRLKKQDVRDPGEGIVVRRIKAGPWTEVQS